MAGSVLVAYATKRGSTREVAEKVAATLRERGFEVELKAARKVKKIRRYDAVVIGGAFYSGRWHRDARRLLRRRRKLLRTKSVAVFGMGPRKDDKASFKRAARQLQRELAKAPGVEPLAHAVFGGVDKKKRVDLRDWDAIGAWAEGVGNGLGSAGAPPAA